MPKFAKIFDLEEENAQVLVTVDCNSEDDTFDLCVETKFGINNGISFKSTVPFEEREIAEQKMNEASLEFARKFYHEVSAPYIG